MGECCHGFMSHGYMSPNPSGLGNRAMYLPQQMQTTLTAGADPCQLPDKKSLLFRQVVHCSMFNLSYYYYFDYYLTTNKGLIKSTFSD